MYEQPPPPPPNIHFDLPHYPLPVVLRNHNVLLYCFCWTTKSKRVGVELLPVPWTNYLRTVAVAFGEVVKVSALRELCIQYIYADTQMKRTRMLQWLGLQRGSTGRGRGRGRKRCVNTEDKKATRQICVSTTASRAPEEKER